MADSCCPTGDLSGDDSGLGDGTGIAGRLESYHIRKRRS